MAGREYLFSRMMLPLRDQILVVPSGDWAAVTLRAMVQEFAGVKGSLVKASCLALQVFFWIFMGLGGLCAHFVLGLSGH